MRVKVVRMTDCMQLSVKVVRMTDCMQWSVKVVQMTDCMQLSEDRLNGCQIFGRFIFLKTEIELNFGFPHISTCIACSFLMNLASAVAGCAMWPSCCSENAVWNVQATAKEDAHEETIRELTSLLKEVLCCDWHKTVLNRTVIVYHINRYCWLIDLICYKMYTVFQKNTYDHIFYDKLN